MANTRHLKSQSASFNNIEHSVLPFCRGCNTYSRRSLAASYSTAHRCREWCSDAVWDRGSSQWYRVQEKQQTLHCRSRSSTDHLSTDDKIWSELENWLWLNFSEGKKKQTSKEFFTEGSSDCEERDLVYDSTPPHRPVVRQPRPLPHNTVNPRFLHYTTIKEMQHNHKHQHKVLVELEINF